MTQVIVAARVNDSSAWEQKFLTHADLFRQMGFAKVYEYGIADDNEVAVCVDVDDVPGFLASLESPDNVAAMENDGVQRDTVKVFVIDKALNV